MASQQVPTHEHRPIAVITGANRGIGLSLTNLYGQHGYKVYALCRTGSDALDAMQGHNLVVLKGIDVGAPSSLIDLASRISEPRIDILINNAGILRDEVLGRLNFSTIEDQLNTNALGPLRIVESLLTKLQDASKLAFITSRMGSIADNTSGGRYGYRMSKVALNMAAVSLSFDLAARHIPVGIYHPGLVGTEMIGGVGNVTPDEAAVSIVERINELDMTKTGQFFHANGERLLW